MIQLSERLMAMEESATIAMSRKSRELKAQGKDVISLSLGEPDFNTPQFIKDAATKAMDDNFTKYMPVPGYDDLRYRRSTIDGWRYFRSACYDNVGLDCGYPASHPPQLLFVTCPLNSRYT